LAGSDASLENAFGPLKIALNTDSAKGKVNATPIATFLGVLRIIKNVLGARISGAYKENPFFKSGSDAPLKEPQVLTAHERSALESAA
jgi:hypothetical protein